MQTSNSSNGTNNFNHAFSGKQEVLIVRNAVFRTQYDVVQVDFVAEQVEVIEAGLSFEDAVALQEQLQPDVNDYSYSEEDQEELI